MPGGNLRTLDTMCSLIFHTNVNAKTIHLLSSHDSYTENLDLCLLDLSLLFTGERHRLNKPERCLRKASALYSFYQTTRHCCKIKKNEKKREKEAAKPVSMWIALFNIAPDKVVLEENKWFLPSQSKPIPARSKSYRDRDLKKKTKKNSLIFITVQRKKARYYLQ